MTAVLRLVENGAGIGIVPEEVLKRSQQKLWRHKLKSKGLIYFAYWEMLNYPSVTKEFFEFVIEKTNKGRP